jgi:hypothetical protein
MRPVVLAAVVSTVACRGPMPVELPAADRDAAAVTVLLELDRTTMTATDELSGSLHVTFRPPPRTSADGATAWCASLDWRLELANETAPLLDLVVEGDPSFRYGPIVLPIERSAGYRFRIVPSAALARLSHAAPVPLRWWDGGSHAMRIVLDARSPGMWTMASLAAPNAAQPVPLDGSFPTRWSTFDVVDGGGAPASRKIDATDAAALVQEVGESSAGAALASFARRGVLNREASLAAVVRAAGERRGILAEAFLNDCGFADPPAIEELAPLFVAADAAGLDCSSHDAPPFFVRIARGRSLPIRHDSDELCTFSVGATMIVLNRGKPATTAKTTATPGLFRAHCNQHPRAWGWLLVE